MLVKIILALTLTLYAVIASQSFMYILALKPATLGLDANGYINLRKLIDAAMMANLKYVMYAALAANLLLVAFLMKTPGSLLFILAAFSLLMLVVDILVAVKGNVPINAIINTWSADNYPTNWTEYRDRWLQLFQYRQVAVITGFISLVIGVVFGFR